MNIQPRYETSQENETSWFPSYSPIATELDGLNRINGGMKMIWFEMTEGNLAYWRRDEERIIDDGFCCGLGVALVATGLWQLRVPLIIGVTGCIFVSYSNLFRY